MKLRWPATAGVLALAGVVAFVAALPLILVVGVALGAAYSVARWYSEKRFWSNYQGQWFLVATRRHGWFDFTNNHILPELPAGVHVFWSEGNDAEEAQRAFRKQFRWRVFGAKRPYLIRIGLGSPQAISFNDLHSFLPSKVTDNAARSAVRDRIKAVEGLGAGV